MRIRKKIRRPVNRRAFLALAVLLVLSASHIKAHSSQPWPGSRTNRRFETEGNYNIVIICLDTLRADHVGCYGYHRNTTPNIDRLSKKGILFERAFAQSNFTLGSHASLFTSKYVHNHKADRIERCLSDKEVTLAQVLGDNGYKTAAFIYNASQLNPRFGLGRGFDTYSFGEEDDRKPSFVKTLPLALHWIRQHKDKRFFVFLHSNDIHEPYHSPFENFFDPGYKGPLDDEYLATAETPFHENNLTRPPRDIRHIIAHYDGGIKYADTFVGELMRQLKGMDLSDKTIVVLLSDHGEILADRGMRFCHGFSLHDEEVRVPLIIAHPGMRKAGIRVSEQVQLIDIMPTILDFLGIARDDIGMQGMSLLALIEGREKEDLHKYVYAECIGGESEKEGVMNRQVMVRDPSHKLISSLWIIREEIRRNAPARITMHNGAIIFLPQEDGYELYDLRKDPGETRNIINKLDKEIEKKLLNKLLLFDITEN